MAKWSFAHQGFTPTAHLDTVDLTDGGHMGLMGGSTTQRIDILEAYIAGLAGSSTPTPMVLARASTVQATPTSLTTGASNAALDPATANLAAAQVAFIASTTKSQRSATLAKLILGLNAFGGIVRWVAAPGAEMRILGNTASLGQVNLSCYTGGTPGLVAAHLLYEPS